MVIGNSDFFQIMHVFFPKITTIRIEKGSQDTEQHSNKF